MRGLVVVMVTVLAAVGGLLMTAAEPDRLSHFVMAMAGRAPYVDHLHVPGVPTMR